jgi:uncharacterized paraquat-inducible protein A
MGSSCPNSHNVFESFLHPQKYRTMMCKDRDKCSRPVCFFAHSPDEVRSCAKCLTSLQQLGSRTEVEQLAAAAAAGRCLLLPTGTSVGVNARPGYTVSSSRSASASCAACSNVH